MADDTEFFNAIQWEMDQLRKDMERFRLRHYKAEPDYADMKFLEDDLESIRLKVLLWLCG